MRFLLPPSRAVAAELDDSAAPLDRYTGVLFRALGVSEWSRAERSWAERHVLVHRPDVGLVRAGGPGDRVVDIDELSAAEGPLLDMRSTEYARRIRVPLGSWTLRVVSKSDDGRRLAVSHWNKHHKGVLIRALVRDRPRLAGVPSLLRWAEGAGVALEPTGPSSLDLIV